MDRPTHSHRCTTQVGDYIVLDQDLGIGSTGTVKLAIHTVTQRQVAVKVINLRDKKIKAEAEKEIRIVSKLDHKNIIRIESIQRNKNLMYIFTEYLEGGDLYSTLIKHGKFTEGQALTYFRQMVSALEHSHSLNICHHDFKLENCVVNANGEVRIIDFAYAEEFHDPHEASMMNYHGSPAYAAPEVLFRKPHSSSVDIFSLGTSLFLMLCGYFPFVRDEATATFEELCANIKVFHLEFPDFLSPECKDLLSKMITKDTKRIPLEQIRRHPWVQQKKFSQTQMQEALLPTPAPYMPQVA